MSMTDRINIGSNQDADQVWQGSPSPPNWGCIGRGEEAVVYLGDRYAGVCRLYWYAGGRGMQGVRGE